MTSDFIAGWRRLVRRRQRALPARVPTGLSSRPESGNAGSWTGLSVRSPRNACEIARELHDMSPTVSVSSRSSLALAATSSTSARGGQGRLSAIEDTSRSALEELRRVLGVLRRADTGSQSPSLARRWPIWTTWPTMSGGGGVTYLLSRSPDVVAVPESRPLRVSHCARSVDQRHQARRNRAGDGRHHLR